MALTTVQSGMMDSIAQYNSFKNRIINGAMVIDQRNAGASVTPYFSYTLDRWYGLTTLTSKFTVQQNAGSVTPPTGFTNYLGVTSSSSYSVISSDTFGILQKVEGFNAADLGWGAAGAATVTLSYWVRSSLTGTFGGSLQNSDSSRSYPFTYTISSANTWEQKSVTIAGDTSGTWLKTNGAGIIVNFGLGSGSTFNSGTAGVWASTNTVQPAGTVSVVGTSGATFYITGVQLEKGSTATAFDYRPYGTELQLCQRYFAKTFPQTVAPASNLSNYYSAICTTGCTTSTYGFTAVWKLPVEMRVIPTLTTYNPYAAGSGFTSSGTGNYAVSIAVIDTSAIALRSSDSTTAGAFLAVSATASAEL